MNDDFDDRETMNERSLSPTGTKADPREEARRWFIVLQERVSVARRREFADWLQSDPAHFEAYAAVEAAWQAAEPAGRRLAERDADQLAAYLKAIDRTNASKKKGRRLTALSLLLAAFLGGGVWLERPTLVQDWFADHSSTRGERRSIALADGSTVLLDADSAIDVSLEGPERRVHLLRGGAFFAVTRSQRPFVVEAGSGEVRVLGTAFAVRLTNDAGLVTLERGSVEVTTAGHREVTALQPGHRARFDADGVGVVVVETANLEDDLAWREGRLVFYRMRLGDVVDEIQRYRPGRIVILTAQLADERVTGSVSLADTDRALASIQASLGFSLTTLTSRLTVIRP